jgi:RNA-dependent RNA polymerase
MDRRWRRGGGYSGRGGRSGRGGWQGQTVYARNAAWKTWLEISVKLDRLPRDTNIFHIWKALEGKGCIKSVVLPNASRSAHAYVAFSPVPETAFWESGEVGLIVHDTYHSVPVTLQPRRSDPDRITIRLLRLDFGFMSQKLQMDIMKTVENPTYYPTLSCNVEFEKLEIHFYCFISDPRREDLTVHHHEELVGERESNNPTDFKIDLRFRHLKDVYLIDMDDDTWGLLISLKSPPIFWKRRRYENFSHMAESARWRDQDRWVRATDVSYAQDWSKEYPVSFQEPFSYIQVGKWTTYRLVFRKSETAVGWGFIKSALEDASVQISVLGINELTWQKGQPSALREMVDTPKSDTAKTELALLHDEGKVHLPFDIRYQLEAAISEGVFTEHSITIQFLWKLLEQYRTSKYMAKSMLEYVTNAGQRIYDPMEIFDDMDSKQYRSPVMIPPHCTWVRKVTITPSTIYLSSPVPETTNRVLRQYESSIDDFIRVQFTDERAEGRLYPHPDGDKNDGLFNRVYRTLRQGIMIGDRHFKFLAFGNSQIREAGAYFYCESEYQSCDDIRKWMGDFTHIKVVAKYASRLGQCFSTTRTPRGLSLGLSTEMIDDIESNGWCFSDGVGIISQWLADEITTQLGLFQNGKVPSAFQFRLGGSKGILVTWPQATFNRVLLRPSQDKFSSQTKKLEIIRASRFTVATLNRQTIVLLSCLGVPDEVFLEMTKDQLSAYTAAMSDAAVALKLLSRHIDENGITMAIARMIQDGFMTRGEPFIKAILELWRAWSMKLLREKARIVVEKGAFVLGCVDETHTLRGHQDAEEADTTHVRNRLPQVFLQVPQPGEPGRYQIITGVCVVGRNPSLHPGDLRVVEAVDVDNPDLKALRDVIVFPAKGDRDIASMCSGGDLDGDDFFVFWDPQLLPVMWNSPPLTHDGTIPKELKRDVNIKDIAKFFVEYMKNDSLSTVALSHLALSDQLPDGPMSEKCIELAELHSNAVDYVKTGQRVHVAEHLRPNRWPHYMERVPRKSYHSRTVTGQLYDLVSQVDFTPDFEGAFDERILRRYNLTDEILGKLRVLKAQYDMAMRQVMTQREIRTEFEVWSTFVMSRPRVGTEYKLQEDMGVVIRGLRDRFVTALAELSGVQHDERDMAALYPFIAAAYRVTWEEVQIALAQCRDIQIIAGRAIPKRTKNNMPLISFPWIFERELGHVATTSKELELPEMPTTPKITKVQSVEQAMKHIAATVDDIVTFHRGVKIFVATQRILDVDVPPFTTNQIVTGAPASTQGVTEGAKSDPAEIAEEDAGVGMEHDEVQEAENFSKPVASSISQKLIKISDEEDVKVGMEDKAQEAENAERSTGSSTTQTLVEISDKEEAKVTLEESIESGPVETTEQEDTKANIESDEVQEKNDFQEEDEEDDEVEEEEVQEEEAWAATALATLQKLVMTGDDED